MGSRLSWDESRFGTNPALYGRDVAKRCGIKHPPVDEHLVADFQGYEIRGISVGETEEEIARFPGILMHKFKGLFQKACGFLIKRDNLILVNENMAPVKKRSTSFHELGHDCLPSHKDLNFAACAQDAIDKEAHKGFEREAFKGGIEMMLPMDIFVDDMMSVNIGMNAIKSLAQRYDAPLESAAIRYAELYSGLCAVIVAEAVKPPVPIHLDAKMEKPRVRLIRPAASGQHKPWISEKTESGILVPKFIGYPLQIKSAAISKRFPDRYFASGTYIPHTSPIFQTYLTGLPWKGELAASDLGRSGVRPPYLAECFTFGFNGDKQVMAVLWLPDRQQDFLEKMK